MCRIWWKTKYNNIIALTVREQLEVDMWDMAIQCQYLWFPWILLLGNWIIYHYQPVISSFCPSPALRYYRLVCIFVLLFFWLILIKYILTAFSNQVSSKHKTISYIRFKISNKVVVSILLASWIQLALTGNYSSSWRNNCYKFLFINFGYHLEYLLVQLKYFAKCFKVFINNRRIICISVLVIYITCKYYTKNRILM